MESQLVYTNFSRVKSKRKTSHVMIELASALLVLFIASIIYYGIKGGADTGKYMLRIFLNTLVCFVTAFAVEYFGIILIDRKTLKAYEEAMKQNMWLTALKRTVTHSYFYVTPLITMLLFPVYTPIHVMFISILVGELIGKMVFGGFGSNIFNPALTGRIFATICFSQEIANGTAVKVGTDISTGATINGIANSSGWLGMYTDQLSNLDLFLGNYRGALGETMAFLLIILGIYLMIRKVIDYRLTLTYVVSLFIFAFFMGVTGKHGFVGSLEFAFRQICFGGILFGAVFCITDPVTSPVSGTGKIVFALIAAFVTAMIRYFGSAPEGVAYSILVANMLAPVIDRMLSRKTNQKMVYQYVSIAALSILVIGSGIGTGLYIDAHKASEKPEEKANIRMTSNEKFEMVYSEMASLEGVIE